MLSFSNFPKRVNGFNVLFYRNLEPNVHLTGRKIKSAVHISQVSLLCAITHIAICRYQHPFTVSFTNYKYWGCSGRKEKYLEVVETVRGYPEVPWKEICCLRHKVYLIDSETQYMSFIICRRSLWPVRFAIPYGNSVINRDSWLTRTGGRILLHLSTVSVICISVVRNSKITQVNELEQWPTNTSL